MRALARRSNSRWSATPTRSGSGVQPGWQDARLTSTDQIVRLWPITINAWIEHACTLAERNLTQQESNEFVGSDRPYVRACPDLPSGYGAPANAPAATYRLD
jgi:hypothetical protein